MKKILFVIENLGGGGAERVLVNLVNNMDRTKYEITVLTLLDKGVNAPNLKEDIKHINLNRKKFKGMKLIYEFMPKEFLYNLYLKKTVKNGNYDLIVAYMTGVPAYIVSGAKLPKIVWIHGEYKEADGFVSSLKISGLKKIYDRFDCIAGVSEYVCNTVDTVIKPSKKAKVIYNTNDVEKIYRLSTEHCELKQPDDKIVISTVGCLETSKGYDRLLNICNRLKEEKIGFYLQILGEGIERKNLEKQISDFGLNDSVALLGYCKNPFCIVKNSDLFVCSSRTEGLSTAVSEAVILGKPVVSTEVSGAKEILGENNEYGIVTQNNEEALYEGLKKMISDKELRAHYSEKVKERAAFFDTAATVKQAENLFEEVIKGR